MAGFEVNDKVRIKFHEDDSKIGKTGTIIAINEKTRLVEVGTQKESLTIWYTIKLEDKGDELSLPDDRITKILSDNGV